MKTDTELSIYKPCGPLRGYVRHYWVLRDSWQACALTFPTGSPQMLFHKRTPLFIPEISAEQSRLTISGQVNFPSHLSCRGDTEMIAVVFYPHTAGIFTGTPPSKFHNLEISGYDLGDKDLADLAARIFSCEDNNLCISFIERWLLARLYGCGSLLDVRRIGHAVGRLMTSPQTTVTELADLTCLSRKQFGRVFCSSVGMMPKEYTRIVRFQKSLWMMQQGQRDYVRIAHGCGYSDQSHFIREFRKFSGHTPVTIFRECIPYSDLFTSLA
ncbi:MAG: AraC family transcriptional regulator [Bacteroidales bacterium]|nr:AraC family transcriptional regulator [Bacteroidales bacterium]MCM1146346.1 AraC family transcriptional regulator [Bacteroidales bacterium]MCM1205216.1 AraC family transcriptional regulator [Bacillota bacterium]MCM1509699.1 AraC family transcriptional regulator [Clostridium sp.]